MNEALSSLGINFKLLAAQLVNFGLLLVLLYLFLYKPILKMLKERSDKVQKGLADAQEIEKKLEEVEIDVQKKLSSAEKDAAQILAEAKSQTEATKAHTLAETEQKAAAILEKTKKLEEAEKTRTMLEVQSEIGKLVVKTIESLAKKDKLNLDDVAIEEALTEARKDR